MATTAKPSFLRRHGSWIFLLSLPISYISVELYLRHRNAPPDGMNNLQAFLAWQPAANYFRVVTTTKGTFLVADGPFCGALPSGPSCFVFDSTGKLIDQSADIGDDESFQSRWYGVPSVTIVRPTGPTWSAPASLPTTLPATRPG